MDGNMQTLGQRIAQLRKRRGLTQEDIAQRLGVSAQAVSKWENDLTCPDISLLPELARQLDVSVDVLLSGEKQPETYIVPVEQRKNVESMLLRLTIDSDDGAKVRMNFPLYVIKAMLDAGISIDGVFEFGDPNRLHSIDWEKLMHMVSAGVIGKLIEMDDGGDRLSVWVE